MWDLNAPQLLLALGLDLVFGAQRRLPKLSDALSLLADRLGPVVGVPFGAVALWAAMIAGVWIPLGVLQWIHGFGKPVGPLLVGLAEVWIVSQCLAAAELNRSVRAILSRLRHGDLAGAQAELDEPAPEVPDLCRRTIERFADGCCHRFLAPLFWTAAFGPAGALLHRTTHFLAARSGPDGRFAGRVDVVLAYLPARLLAVLSETFRKFRSFGKIRREAKASGAGNAAWARAAAAHDLGIRLGDGAFHPSGDDPTESHLGEALVWGGRIFAFAGLLALLALR
jgi:cobalamin biosynthesis protein CobD/CbiB